MRVAVATARTAASTSSSIDAPTSLSVARGCSGGAHEHQERRPQLPITDTNALIELT